jgi:hypothetical protein
MYTFYKSQKILAKTFEEVAESARYLCGIFPEQHFSYKLNNSEHRELVQDRFCKLLCKDVYDSLFRYKIMKANGY